MSFFEGAGLGEGEVMMEAQYLQEVTDQTGVTSTSCLLCGKYFSYRHNAKTHVMNVHLAGAQVTCGLCDKVLKNLDSLKTHFRAQHGLAKKQAFTK